MQLYRRSAQYGAFRRPMVVGIYLSGCTGIEQPQRAADAVERSLRPSVLKVIAGTLEQVAKAGESVERRLNRGTRHGAPRRARCRASEAVLKAGAGGAVSRGRKP